MRTEIASPTAISTRITQLSPRLLRIVKCTWLGVTAAVVVYAWWIATLYRPPVDDAHAYWLASMSHPYGITAMGTADAYHYAPAFLWFIAPLKLLPFEVFRALWCGLSLACLTWLCGRWWTLPALLFTVTMADYMFGNINSMMAVAIAVGFRWPATWAFILLTKVAPGVGLLWFAFRREWRSLAVALGMTGALVFIGLARDPDTWLAWFRFVIEQPFVATSLEYTVPGPPWFLRLVAAVALIFWGARRGSRWVVPLAGMLVLPWWAMIAGLGLGSLRLWREDRGPVAAYQWGHAMLLRVSRGRIVVPVL